MSYWRTASGTLPDDPEYGIDLAEVRTTTTQREERYLHVLYLPDDRDRTDDRTGVTLGRREVYELAVRDQRELTEWDGTFRPVSQVIERHGPYNRERAFAAAVELAAAHELPLYHEIARLRPDTWIEPRDWATCPRCTSDAITLVTDLDEPDFTLLCRACDAKEAERRALFDEWLHCPSCGSGDVNVELSTPGGNVWWSCDDCLYDTSPAPIDRGYTAVRSG